MLPREQLEDRGIRNADVLRAIRQVPREEFVPEESRRFANEDRPLHIGYNVTISQPYIVAAMTELLDVRPDHQVLEIGTGSGYQTAVLSKLAGRVWSVEIIPELAAASKAILQRLGYTNVEVRQGDGYAGWPEAGPFDRVIVTAAPLEIPVALFEQLKPGGKLVAPEGGKDDQFLVVVEKLAGGRLERRQVFPVLFVPMVPSRSGA